MKNYFVILLFLFITQIVNAEDLDSSNSKQEQTRLSFTANLGLINESITFGGGLRWRTHGINYMSSLVAEYSTGITNKTSSISVNLMEYIDFNPSISMFLQAGLIYEKYDVAPYDKDRSPTNYKANAGLGVAFYFNNLTIASGYSIFSGFLIKFGIYSGI